MSSQTTIKGGCKYHNDCFTCPYPDCIEGKGFKRSKLKGRQEARILFLDNVPLKDIALQMGKSKRTIQRYLRDTNGDA